MKIIIILLTLFSIAISQDKMILKSGEEIMGIFDSLYNGGHTIIMVTHEDDIASHAQRTIKLFDGKITEDAETNPK